MRAHRLLILQYCGKNISPYHITPEIVDETLNRPFEEDESGALGYLLAVISSALQKSGIVGQWEEAGNKFSIFKFLLKLSELAKQIRIDFHSDPLIEHNKIPLLFEKIY